MGRWRHIKGTLSNTIICDGSSSSSNLGNTNNGRVNIVMAKMARGLHTCVT